MEVRDISQALKDKKRGWIAINEDNEVVERAVSFAAIFKKVEKSKKKLVIVPIAADYQNIPIPQVKQ